VRARVRACEVLAFWIKALCDILHECINGMLRVWALKRTRMLFFFKITRVQKVSLSLSLSLF